MKPAMRDHGKERHFQCSNMALIFNTFVPPMKDNLSYKTILCHLIWWSLAKRFILRPAMRDQPLMRNHFCSNMALHFYTFIPLMKDQASYKTTFCGLMGWSLAKCFTIHVHGTSGGIKPNTTKGKQGHPPSHLADCLYSIVCRVPTLPGKPGKPGILSFTFPGLENAWNLLKKWENPEI